MIIIISNFNIIETYYTNVIWFISRISSFSLGMITIVVYSVFNYLIIFRVKGIGYYLYL